ncbi:MAG: PhzF family phenazine biosynthesis isomerase [Candidatus Aegiribacteria sp.]|nr:PhzF family phenazine biosynthesis isomerase [Candidatus Aegiribacteria sp.]
MELSIYQVDAFTSETFKGNPAGVCITEVGLDETTMLSIAGEMALSETAFLALDTMQLRWFTPKCEIKLCGHGTLAAAHVMNELGLGSAGERIEFNTLSGVLWTEIDNQRIHLYFPAPELDMEASVNPELTGSLGISPESIIDHGVFNSKELLVLDGEDKISGLSPNFDRLSNLKGRGTLVTAASGSDVDFVSRYFAPWVGVNEDPVTGSAHCALCVYWSKALNKRRMRGYQASERGGFVDVEMLDSGGVRLSGSAVTVLKGKMMIPTKAT